MAAADVRLRPAIAADRHAVLDLLERASLPAAGIGASLPGFVVAERDGTVVGVAGLEVHGRDGLLRSVAVSEGAQGSGIGGHLTDRILSMARAARLDRVYLLTTTADGYFARRGFRRIARDAVSEEVRASVEFAEACPASAVTMVLDLS